MTLLRRLGNHSRKNRLYRAFRELGRVIRTVTLLRFLSEPALRETITAITNRVEAFHGFAEWLMVGGRLIGHNDPDYQGTVRERQFDLRADVLARTPQARAIFFDDGGTPRLRRGATFRQPALAATLRHLAADGADWMYRGPWADKFVDLVRAHGGRATLADLVNYRPIWATPQVGDFAGHRVHTLGQPDTGGTSLVLALNLLAEANLPVTDAVARPFFHGPDYLTGDTVVTPAEDNDTGATAHIRQRINSNLLGTRFRELASQARQAGVPREDIMATVQREFPQTIDDRFDTSLLQAVQDHGQPLSIRPIDDRTLPRGFWGALSINPEHPRLHGGLTPFSGGCVESI